MNWELILKHLNGECLPGESDIVLLWLEKKEEHRVIYAYLSRRSQQLNRPLKKDEIDKEWLSLLERLFATEKSQPKKSYKLLSALAAAACIVIAFAWGIAGRQPVKGIEKEEVFTVQTPAHSRGECRLPDGTKVYMTPGTTIKYSSAFNKIKRELTFTGEAFFDVKHIDEKPFIVNTSTKLKITVLGTSFQVYSRGTQKEEVNVATGLVGVSQNKQTRFLKAGEGLIFSPHTPNPTIHSVDTKEASGLKDGVLVFNKCDLQQLTEKLEHWYNIRITVLPTALKNIQFSGELRDNGLKQVLKSICYSTSLKCKMNKGDNQLTFY